MWEHPLSCVVLEFFTWNPNWDKHLTKMMEDRAEKYKEKNKKADNGFRRSSPVL